MSSLVPVAELAEQIRGVSYDKNDASTTPRPGYLPVLRAGNIADDGLVFNDLVYVPAGRVSAKQRIRQNDVVIAASSGSLDVVGKAARALSDYNGGFGAFCKVLRPGAKVEVVLPPIEQQEQFVNRAEKIWQVRARGIVALGEANALFASLQHRAFRGEL